MEALPAGQLAFEAMGEAALFDLRHRQSSGHS
jgi:hypothetical protein